MLRGDEAMLLDVEIRTAQKTEDLAQVLTLLRDASLPTEGVEEHFANFLVAVDGEGNAVGAIGMEQYADGTGLLRSAVVHASLRNSGIGSRLYEELIKAARQAGMKRIILLTTTAEKYFARKGFKSIARLSITGPVTTSPEFLGACPETATCMELLIK
jgi:amino-acid N-acetyltransferase